MACVVPASLPCAAWREAGGEGYGLGEALLLCRGALPLEEGREARCPAAKLHPPDRVFLHLDTREMGSRPATGGPSALRERVSSGFLTWREKS